MRFLIIIATIAALFFYIRHVMRTEQGMPDSAALPKSGEKPVPDVEPEPDHPDTPLEVELGEAVAAFEESRRQVSPEAGAMRSSIASLIEQTHQLELRVRADEAFSRRVRQPVKRLLLSLYSVVRQAARATNQTPGAERDALLGTCSDAIRRSADQLGRITEKADEVSLQRLEADLEVLESRLSQRSSVDA